MSQSDAPTPSPEQVHKFRVKFADGPAAGIMKDLDREVQTLRYFAWTYEATGKRDGDHWLFVKRPNSRVLNRLIGALSASNGSDPRLVPKMLPNKVIPRGRNEQCWCGSGKKYKRCHSSPSS